MLIRIKSSYIFLSAAGMGNLTDIERKCVVGLDGLMDDEGRFNNLFVLLNRFVFIILCLLGFVFFLIYAFIDIQNLLIFLAFAVNLF